MLLTRAAVTPAQDRVRVRLQPKWHPSSLQSAPHFEAKQDEILCAAEDQATRSFAHRFILARGLCDRLLDARNNRARELRIHGSGAPEQCGRGEPSGLWTRTTSTGGLPRDGREDPEHQTCISTGRRQVTGLYRCSAGNSLCRNGDNERIDQWNRKREPGEPEYYVAARRLELQIYRHVGLQRKWTIYLLFARADRRARHLGSRPLIRRDVP